MTSLGLFVVEQRAQRRTHGLLRIALAVGVNAFVCVALLEGALRVRPELIPLAVLVGFQPTLRNEVAERRNLPRLAAMQPVARDDGGPRLTVHGPSSAVTFPASRAAGAVAEVTMDRRGFCNPGGSARGGRSDVVTIGDSFTFCTAVAPDATWTAQLARRTGKSTYNLGRMGIGIHEYLQLLKRYGLALSPRTVIMNVYEGNDLRDAVRFVEARQDRRSTTTPTHSPESWLLTRSYAAATAASLLGGGYDHEQENPRADRFMHKLRWRYKVSDFRYSLNFADGRVAFNRDGADLEEPRFARALSEDRIPPKTWKAMRTALGDFVELGRQHGFRPVVSYTPAANTTYASVVTFRDESLPEIMREFSDTQRSFYVVQARRLGYQLIDLTPALQASAATHGKAALLYRPDDLHLTALGHAVIAEALAAQLPNP